VWVFSKENGHMNFNEQIFDEIKPHILKKSIQFHVENPEVYVMVKKFAVQAKESKRNRFGIAMIWERMRWFTMIETTDKTYKLNNNHKAFYSRMLMIDDPFFKSVFSRKITNK